MRQAVSWIAANQARTHRLVRVQALIRGWLLRRRLSIAGPGVLHRTGLCNTDDFATCIELSNVPPFDYFEFEENGKRWGFRFDSLWAWSVRSVTPVNPYTKVPLTAETRKRLRAIWIYRFRRGIVSSFEPEDIAVRTRQRWTVLCQHFADYGFVDVRLEMLVDLTRLDMAAFFVLLERDLDIVLPATDPFRSRLLGICRRRSTDIKSPLWCANSLLYMLSLPADPYGLTFSILSALYRT